MQLLNPLANLHCNVLQANHIPILPNRRALYIGRGYKTRDYKNNKMLCNAFDILVITLLRRHFTQLCTSWVSAVLG